MNDSELNDVQFRILDAVYFVEPFERIAEEAGAPLPVIVDEMRYLIDRGWIQVMQFDPERNDYVRTGIFDTDHLEQYHFLATKAGLLKHNGG
jgi:hypothetical protein